MHSYLASAHVNIINDIYTLYLLLFEASFHCVYVCFIYLFFYPQWLSCIWLLVISRTAWMLQASLSFTISLNLLKFRSIKSLMLSNDFILCHLLLLLTSIFLSIRVFSNDLVIASDSQNIRDQYQSYQWIFWVDFL